MRLIQNENGFTLIELMIVVVIVAILATIAYPSYQQYVMRAHRSDCQQGLLIAANQQERFMSQCRWFASTLTGTRACGADSTAGVLGLPSTTSPEGQCTIQFDATSPGTIAAGCTTKACGFTLVAIRKASEASDGNFRIDSTGRRQWDRDNSGTFGDNANEDRWK